MNFSYGRAALLQSKLAARTMSHEKAAIELIAVVMRTVLILVSINFYTTFIRRCESRSVNQKRYRQVAFDCHSNPSLSQADPKRPYERAFLIF
jgi:hypothetical protein